MGFTIIACPYYRFVRILPQMSVCFLVPRSRSLGRRCLFFSLEGIQTLYFPSFQFVRQNPNKAQGGQSFRCSNHSTLAANSTLVSTASPIVGPAAYPSASVGQAPNFASGGYCSPPQRYNAPSRVACIRDNLEVRNFSKGSQLCVQVVAPRNRKAIFRGLEMFLLLV